MFRSIIAIACLVAFNGPPPPTVANGNMRFYWTGSRFWYSINGSEWGRQDTNQPFWRRDVVPQ